jgi:hypothetical protein
MQRSELKISFPIEMNRHAMAESTFFDRPINPSYSLLLKLCSLPLEIQHPRHILLSQESPESKIRLL